MAEIVCNNIYNRLWTGVILFRLIKSYFLNVRWKLYNHTNNYNSLNINLKKLLVNLFSNKEN